jgi:FkbM family methyltransferase
LGICKSNRSPTNIFEHCALVSGDYQHKLVEGNFNEQDGATSLTAQINIILPDYDIHQTEGVREKENREMVSVPAKTLQRIIDDHSITCIDYMSLDVEGFEYQAMNGLDFTRNPPSMIQVETSTYQYRIDKMITYLDNKGYAYLGPPNPDALNDRLFKLR